MDALSLSRTAVLIAASGLALSAQNWHPDIFRKVHLDYHLNPWIKGAAASVTLEEARRQMRMMKESGVQAVEFFAYDHFGNAFYPSDVVQRHPDLRNDYSGNMAKAAREQGLKVIAYVNVFGSVYLFSKHPDWYVVDKSGTSYPAAAWLPQDHSYIDATSPFLEQVFKPLLKELISRYSPDAVWLDGGSWLVENHSYSRYSREWYRKVSGEDIPDVPGETAGEEAWRKWNRYVAWRRSLILDYLASITKFIHEIQPGILVADNGVGRFDRGIPVMEGGRLRRWATARETGVDFLTGDPVPFIGNHVVVLSREARYQSTLGLPFDYHTERFQGWGEWHIRETTDFKMECSTTIANGGRCFMADQPWPDGTLEPEVYRRFKETYDFIRAREDPYRRAEVVSDIGILAAETTNTLAGDLRPLAPASSRTDAANGAFLVLVQEGFPFQIYSEANLGEATRRARALVVPEQALLLDSTVDALRTFVERGGRLLITGQSGRFDYDGGRRETGRMERLLGVKVKGTRRAPLNYFRLAEDFRSKWNLPDLPLMVRGSMYEFEAGSGTALARVLEPRDDPWDEQGRWRQYTVTGAMPPKRDPAGAGAVLLEAGKGRILYVAGNWFATYQKEGNPTVRKMLAAFVSTLLPEEERSLVVRKPLRVEVNLMRNEKGYLVSLVNSEIQKQPSQFAQAEELAPAENIDVRLHLPQTVRQVRLIPENVTLPLHQTGPEVRFTVPRLEISAIVQVETR